MNTPARFCCRNALHAMHPGLEFQPCEHAFSGDRRDDFLIAAEIAFGSGYDFNLPPSEIGIAGIHTKEVGSEERRLVSSRACSNLEDRALFVCCIFRKKRDPKLLFEFRYAVGELSAL